MEIQGIKILRISDLKRFFDLPDFWLHKEDFLKIDRTLFFDNEMELKLYSKIRNWLIKGEKVGNFVDNKLVVTLESDEATKKSETRAYSLGRLLPEVVKFKDRMANKGDLEGLTLLYILLDAASPKSEIELQYDLFAGFMSEEVMADFIPCYTNRVFEGTSIPCFPIKRHVIANMNSKESIVISHVSEEIILAAGDCVIGLFDSNQRCYKLLSHSVNDDINGFSLCLKINKISKNPYLKLESRRYGTKSIEGVCSIAIEKGGYPVYMTMDGNLHYDDEKCFALNQKYESVRVNNQNEELIAFEVDSSYNYSLYTFNKKIY